MAAACVLVLASCAQVLRIEEFRGSEQPTGATGTGGSNVEGKCGSSSECATPVALCSEPVCEAGMCTARPAAEGTACGAVSRCNAEGQCLLIEAEACSEGAQCETTICADKVCCDVNCGVCASCALPKREGTCSPIESGISDDAGGCVAGLRCDGLGRCAVGMPVRAIVPAVDAVTKVSSRGLAHAARPSGGWLVGGDSAAKENKTSGLLLQLSAEGTVESNVSFSGGVDNSVSGVAVDANGVGYAVGRCSPEALLPLAIPCGSKDNLTASVILKLDTTGAVTNAQIFDDTPAYDALLDVAVHPAGGILVAGYTGVGAGGSVATVAKLNAEGTLGESGTWRFDLGASPTESRFSSVALAPNGDILVAGTLNGTAMFGTKSITSSNYSRDAIVACLDSTGKTIRWARSLGGGYEDRGVEVAVAPDGTVALGGIFSYSMTVDENVTWNGADAKEGFVIVLDGLTGATRWGTPIVGAGDTVVSGVAFDAASNLLVAGSFGNAGAAGTLSFLGMKFSAVSAYSSDGFVGKIAPTGMPLWVKQVGGASSDVLFGVVATSNSVVAVGTSGGTFDFGSTKLSTSEKDSQLTLFEWTP